MVDQMVGFAFVERSRFDDIAHASTAFYLSYMQTVDEVIAGFPGVVVPAPSPPCRPKPVDEKAVAAAKQALKRAEVKRCVLRRAQPAKMFDLTACRSEPLDDIDPIP
eukprot:14581386-Alexandrium_andersonii.AAC.1